MRHLVALAVGVAGRCTHVVDAVPDLAEDQESLMIVSEADVDRSERARLGFERADSAVCPCEPEDKLLDREVAAIARLRRRSGSREARCEGPIDDDPDADPEGERRAGAATLLQIGNPSGADAEALAGHGL